MKYTIWQNVRYMSNYSRAVAKLHVDLDHIPPVNLPKDYSFRVINQEDEYDLKIWSTIVTDAYNDKNYTINDAKINFDNHLFLNIFEGYFLLHNNLPIATVLIGTYKENNKIVGDARLAVKKEYQRKGLGRLLISYGFEQMRNKGFKYGESVISAIRTPSILLHYKCGFYPPLSRRSLAVFKKQKRYFFIHLFIRFKLNRTYREYLRDLSRKFNYID